MLPLLGTSSRRLVLLAALIFVFAVFFLTPSSHYILLSHGSSGKPASSTTASHEYERLQARIETLIKPWTPPPQGASDKHFPPYRDYIDKNYDPNVWETFEQRSRLLGNDDTNQIHRNAQVKPAIYLPYPEYTSSAYKRLWRGDYVACRGPRGLRLNESTEDVIRTYHTRSHAFPQPDIGDANVTAVDLNLCFDRYGRYGPYGLGQDENIDVVDRQQPLSKPEWSQVQWGHLQEECVQENGNRYEGPKAQPLDLSVKQDPPVPEFDLNTPSKNASLLDAPSTHSRTAILIRTWQGYNYTENDLHTLRALVTETALYSGGEYQVFLLLNIKDKGAQIFDQKVRDRLIAENVPEEFRDMTIPWTEGLMKRWYPEVGDWQVFWQQWMPVQWFSKTHPEFEFVWNWETDARYTGHHYAFLEGLADFAKRAPRKYMWERAQRFYIAAEHGTYEQFLNSTDRAIEMAMREEGLKPVWGPQPYDRRLQRILGPVPPTTMDADHFEWGVGEEADLITLLPMWDTRHTEWSFRDKIWNFVPGVRPQFSTADGTDRGFHHPEFINIPRRAFIITVTRLSRRLLLAMHAENVRGRAMNAEMWPATTALHHGLKAVHAPHPIWTDREWPSWYLDAVVNADGGRAAQWSQQFDSPYNHDREYNFKGWSWYYGAHFGRKLYRSWLGWTDSGPSGPESSNATHVDGRLCLPPMLLHPVKKVYA